MLYPKELFAGNSARIILKPLGSKTGFNIILEKNLLVTQKRSTIILLSL